MTTINPGQFCVFNGKVVYVSQVVIKHNRAEIIRDWTFRNKWNPFWVNLSRLTRTDSPVFKGQTYGEKRAKFAALFRQQCQQFTLNTSWYVSGRYADKIVRYHSLFNNYCKLPI